MKKAMYVRLLAPGRHATDTAFVQTISAWTPHNIRAEHGLGEIIFYELLVFQRRKLRLGVGPHFSRVPELVGGRAICVAISRDYKRSLGCKQPAAPPLLGLGTEPPGT